MGIPDVRGLRLARSSDSCAPAIGARLVVMMVLGALAVACSSLPGASPPSPESSPTVQPTAAATSTVQPTVAPTTAASTAPDTQAPGRSAPPLPSTSDEACELEENHVSAGVPSDKRDRSDTFWSVFTGPGLYDEEYESLREMFQAVHLVVRGHIAAVYIGQEIVDEAGPTVPVAFISVAVDEVLKGTPVSVTPGHVEVGLWAAGSQWEEIQESVPDDDYLLFLYNDADYRAERDMPSANAELEQTTYFRPNDQAVIRELDDVVSTFKYYAAACQYGMDRFPLGLEGLSFADVVQQVRDLSQ